MKITIPFLFSREFPIHLLLLLSWLLISNALFAGAPSETKWKAELPKPGHSLGSAIATSSNSIAIGALLGGDNEEGAVHLFNPETGGQTDILTSPNPEAESLFGFAIAMDDEFLLVGAPLEDGQGTDEGVVYLFDRVAKETVPIFCPSNEDGSVFGASVAMENGIAVIGCLREDGEGENRGAAYLYDLRNRQFLHRLEASDAADDDEFGLSVAILGDLVAVGAWKKAHPEGALNSGAVYLFKVESGNEIRKIVNPVAQNFGEFFGNFGSSLLLDEGGLVVGAPGERHSFSELNDDEYKEGAVYVFDPGTGEQLHRLTSQRSLGDAVFGYRLASSGDLLLVGAPEDSAGRSTGGAAYVFDLQTGREMHQLIPSDGGDTDEFGFAVGFHEGKAIVGSRFEGEDPINASGAVYLYTFGHQPDLLIGKTRQDLRGGNRYQPNGAGQQIRVRSDARLRFFVKAQNDGSLQDRLQIRSRNSRKFDYRITKTGGGGNVSGAMMRGSYRSEELFPEEAEVFRVDVRARGGDRQNLRETATIRGKSVGDASIADAVKAQLQVRR